MFETLIRRYRLGKAAERKHFEVWSQSRGTVIWITFAELLDLMAEKKSNRYRVEVEGYANHIIGIAEDTNGGPEMPPD